MEKRYVIALDQGTTSSRAILFDRERNLIGSVSREFPQIYPREGWVEHNPADIWSSQYGCMTELIARCDVSPAAGFFVPEISLLTGTTRAVPGPGVG